MQRRWLVSAPMTLRQRKALVAMPCTNSATGPVLSGVTGVSGVCGFSGVSGSMSI